MMISGAPKAMLRKKSLGMSPTSVGNMSTDFSTGPYSEDSSSNSGSGGDSSPGLLGGFRHIAGNPAGMGAGRGLQAAAAAEAAQSRAMQRTPFDAPAYIPLPNSMPRSAAAVEPAYNTGNFLEAAAGAELFQELGDLLQIRKQEEAEAPLKMPLGASQLSSANDMQQRLTSIQATLSELAAREKRLEMQQRLSSVEAQQTAAEAAANNLVKAMAMQTMQNEQALNANSLTLRLAALREQLERQQRESVAKVSQILIEKMLMEQLPQTSQPHGHQKAPQMEAAALTLLAQQQQQIRQQQQATQQALSQQESAETYWESRLAAQNATAVQHQHDIALRNARMHAAQQPYNAESRGTKLQQTIQRQQQKPQHLSDASGLLASPPGFERVAGGGKGGAFAPAHARAKAPATPQQKKGQGKASKSTPKGKAAKATQQQQQQQQHEAAMNAMSGGETLRLHLRSLRGVEQERIFTVRKINRLGFQAAEILEEHFKSMGQVEKSLVAHSHMKARLAHLPSRIRPATLGFVVMKTAQDVQNILAMGEDQTIAGCLVRVQSFQHQPSLEEMAMAEMEANDDLAAWDEEA
eukprot:TRINITY_DN3265_c0_g1_i1.p1 TRINITY_DN3265_c0_g1~~TRINITY_DN3265_c0_g1_i1.p1  ORF type:complete len:580 (-),score=218.93 TRINITY_DN3265_c0_g1_i1:368-2107(-)